MEMDEKLSYSLCVTSCGRVYWYPKLTDVIYSLQFDPAPRVGEPLVTRRVPDYFLVSCRPIHFVGCLTLLCSNLCSVPCIWRHTHDVTVQYIAFVRYSVAHQKTKLIPHSLYFDPFCDVCFGPFMDLLRRNNLLAKLSPLVLCCVQL